MQFIIKNFIRDFKHMVEKSKFNKSVISIVLLGSAARGEFIKGESDIDFIVIVKSSSDKMPVTKFVSKCLEKLNKRHNLKLEETCLDRKKYDNKILNMIIKIEAATFFGTQFYVISLNDYDFFKNKISDPRLWLIATFLLPINQFLLNVKDTGITVYGKNLIKLIDARMAFSDKIKIIVDQYLILIGSSLMLPFNPKLALKNALKASLNREEFDLMFLHKHLSGYKKDRKAFESVVSDDAEAIKHIRKALNYRKNYNRITVSHDEATKFISDTYSFVFNSLRKMGSLQDRA
ncbi:nucleotidyltransferase domain-containing protein [archaeon]|nr:nucleotidyltransferase domain-containing protein [archaeon]